MTKKIDLEKKAYQYVKYIHADQSLKGCKYLIYAIILTMENPEIHYTGKDGLYQQTAEYFHVQKASSVERGIRHLCERLYSDTSVEQYEKLFGTMRKITNRRLISTACNFIRYESEKLQ